MMSLKPRNVDFQETWANLRETVAGVVGLQSVERAVWNTRFSDVYALCVAHPEPLADRLYDETRIFLEEHVSGLLQRVRGHTPLENNDHNDGLLIRYVTAWREYSQGVAYLNSLYSYLNLQHVKRQKVSDAEIIYGSSATTSSPEHDSRQLEVGELGLVTWERVLVAGLRAALGARVGAALAAARAHPLDPALAAALRDTVRSTVQMQSFRVRNPLALYHSLVLEPFLAAATEHHAKFAAELLQSGDISYYMKHVLEGLEREESLCSRFLHSGSRSAVRAAFERAAVAAHLPALHAHAHRLLRDHDQHRADLRRMYQLLKPLGPSATKPLVEAALQQAQAHGHSLLDAPHHPDEAHSHFVLAMLQLHDKYSALFADVFDGAQPFMGALDKACSAVVNRRGEGGASRAAELLARWCDAGLRRRGGGGGAGGGGGGGAGRDAAEGEADARLDAAIVVFKYVDDKDVFQKYYARALARRLIHQLSASMEQEEAMINRLKAACGYEFTNKLHRMFTDVALSADLNAKFQQHLRDQGQTTGPGFSVQVLQAGAWPLGGAMAPLAPPAALQRPAAHFEAFYRAAFSGRRLAWLHHLCCGDLRTHYTHRVYHVSATTPQCGILLAFERADVLPVREVRMAVGAAGGGGGGAGNEAWTRQLRPLLEAGLLQANGPPHDGDTELTLNLSFSSKRTKLRLAQAAPVAQGGAPAAADSSATHCDDDRKMYLQAALVRIMKQRKVLRHTELIQEVVSQARGSFAPSVAMIKKCIEALIDKQYLERAPGTLDTYSYLA